MKKLLPIMLLLGTGLMSCTSCASNTLPVEVSSEPTSTALPTATPSASSDPVPVRTDVLVKKNKCEFTLPGLEWKSLPTCDEDNCPVAFVNKDETGLVVLLNEKFESSFDDYVLTMLREVKEAGATVDSVSEVTLSGHKFILMDSSKDNVRVWLWVGLVGDQGYVLSCGGPVDNHDLCFDIAKSFKLN